MSVSSHVQNDREDENQAIDRMFAFVKHEHMETPKSSIVTRHRSMSTPRRPLATSTPLFSSHVALASGGGGRSHIKNADRRCSRMDTSMPPVNHQQIFHNKCRAILTEIALQQDQIIQATDVISLCQKKLIFNGTFQEMNAQRTLLVANERRRALHTELEKLKKRYGTNAAGAVISVGGGLSQTSFFSMQEFRNAVSRCAINLTSIKVLLNRSFYIKTVDEDISFSFLAICKSDGQIYATQLMNVLDMGTLRVSTIQFRESIRFQNLPTDFTLFIEIYALKIMKRLPTPRYACASKIAHKAKALIGGNKKVAVAAALDGGGDAAAATNVFPSSDFRRCGFLQLNRSTAGKQHFFLEEAEYPLEGTIEVRCEYLFT